MNREDALDAALEQINVAFGKRENLSPEQRLKAAQRRIDWLLNVRMRLVELAWADHAKERDEQGWFDLEPTTAFMIGWFLRKEADSDHVISMDGKASEALEEAASHIESGQILASPQEMLVELDAEVAALRADIVT